MNKILIIKNLYIYRIIEIIIDNLKKPFYVGF